LAAVEIKIFGERNTGTNALKALIETNSRSNVAPSVAREIDPHFDLKAKILSRLPTRYRASATEAYIDRLFRKSSPKLAWKHSATRFNDVACFEGCLVVGTIRNPISWLVGLHRAPYHTLVPVPSAFSAFLDLEWQLCARDNLEASAVVPAELWNQKARSLLDLIEALQRRNLTHVLVRFEDFVMDQNSTFARLKEFLHEPAADCSIVKRSTKDRSKDHSYYADYYGQERWLKEIDRAAIQAAMSRLDWGIARSFGYSPPQLN
jgi:hypothetical protein